MTTKLILIEGIPGSGKTTIASRIAERYRRLGLSVNLYLEGQAHPADLGWIACVPIEKYYTLLEKYASLSGEIKSQTSFKSGYAMIAYTQISTDTKDFHKELEAFEVYDGRASDEMFFRLHYDRWRAFGEQAAKEDALNIFECAFMQNHINELLLWRSADEDNAAAHHNSLIDKVKDLSPILIYLSQPDIKETISRIAGERVSPEGSWIDRVIAYCENSFFGKRNNIKGFDGVMEFFTIRKELEMKILGRLSIPYAVIENPDYDWDDVWAKLEMFLDSKIPAK
jgi:hypothetical protein